MAEENLSGLSLSFDSSSFESGISDEERNFEVAPYQFEPYCSDADNDSNEIDSSESETEEQDRLNNTDWCLCGCCVAMPTSKESICCREITRMEEKMAEVEVSCVTNHPGFETVCLDIYVLETAYYQYRQQFGAYEGSLVERNRYTAYRQLVRWCWGYLGRNVRVPLPACAVKKIRSAFPSANYRGFHDDM